MSTNDLIIVANSPGELSALVKPVAETLADQLQDTRIILVLTPCQYTSGKELEYLKTIRGISEIIPAQDYKNWLLKIKKPQINFSSKGLVLYLGGDLAHAMLVAKKVQYPAYAYVQDFLGWPGFYKKFFIPDTQSQIKLDRRGLLRDKLQIVGNLMVDSISDLPKWTPEKNVITFLPGSRNWQINHTTPIYEKIIQQLIANNSHLKFQLVSSPFMPAKEIKDVKVISFEEAHNSELVITIPGTNTARLAARGIPMISIFPLDNPDVIPLEGIGHFICKIPFVGSKIKRKIVAIANKQTKFFALPNIKADQEIVPEIRGIIDPKEIASKAIQLLNDLPKRQQMSQELIKSMGEPGAAVKIGEEINEALQQIT